MTLLAVYSKVRFTERLNTAIAALLDGKIIVMVKGAPTILICLGLFFDFFVTCRIILSPFSYFIYFLIFFKTHGDNDDCVKSNEKSNFSQSDRKIG